MGLCFLLITIVCAGTLGRLSGVWRVLTWKGSLGTTTEQKEEPPDSGAFCTVAKDQFWITMCWAERLEPQDNWIYIDSLKKTLKPLRVNLSKSTVTGEVEPRFKMWFSFLFRESTLPLLALLIILVMLASACSISIIWHLFKFGSFGAD